MVMVYQRFHDCKQDNCTILFSYARINGKFKKVGVYGSQCKKLISITQDTVEESEWLRVIKNKRNNTTILLQELLN